MRRWWIIPLVLVLAVAAALVVWKPWAAPRTLDTAHELGYVIEYETDPATEHIHQSNPDRDGKEYVGVVVQGDYSVMILDGTVTVNRQPRGTVKKGDRLKVSLDGRLWVNGVERRP